MRCCKCNFESVPSDRFCQHCGAKLEPEHSEPQANPGVQPAAVNQPDAKAIANKAADTNAEPKSSKVKARLFLFLQLFIYLAIAAVTVLLIFLENGVRVQAAFSDDAFRECSLFSVIANLITGGDKYNPTAISIVMGVSTIILVFSSAILWMVTFFTKIIKKFHKESHLMTLIITALNLAAVCLLLPLAYRFSGVLTQICAREANFPVSEVSSIGSVWTFVFSGIILLLIIAELVFASKEKKFKKQYQKGC